MCVCVCVCLCGSSKQRQTNWRNHEVAGRVSFVLQKQMGTLGVMRPHLLIYPLPSSHTQSGIYIYSRKHSTYVHWFISVALLLGFGFPSTTSLGRQEESHQGIILLDLLDNRLDLLNKIHCRYLSFSKIKLPFLSKIWLDNFHCKIADLHPFVITKHQFNSVLMQLLKNCKTRLKHRFIINFLQCHTIP